MSTTAEYPVSSTAQELLRLADGRVSFEPCVHKEQQVIVLRFEQHQALNALVRQIPGARWSRTLKGWHVRDTDQMRQQLGLEPKTLGKNALNRISETNRPAYERMAETLMLKGYSPNTQRTYLIEFAQLLVLLKDVPVNDLTPERLRSYLLYCTTELKLSEAILHSRLNAIKFYFEQVLKRESFFADIPRPKKPSTLPKHISPRDVKKLFETCTNLKHNTMLKLCYGMGLRVSEIVNLKVSDIDSGNMQVLIARAKGKKDRYANLPESLLEQLRTYYREYHPKEYLFEGQYGGQYSIRSAQQVFHRTMEAAGINKKIGIHSLRHSYATHLLEAGTDIGHIQKLLGHADIKTTLIYAQVTDRQTKNIKSPLDSL